MVREDQRDREQDGSYVQNTSTPGARLKSSAEKKQEQYDSGDDDETPSYMKDWR